MTQEELDDKLTVASWYGKTDEVKEAIEKGADIHARNDEALINAAESGHLDIVKYLVKNGADIHARDDYALMYAARKGYKDVVAYLSTIEYNYYIKKELPA